MKKLNLITSVSKTGYGVVGNNVLKALSEQGVEVSLFNKGTLDPKHEDKTLHVECTKRKQLFDYDAPCLSIWHQFDLAHSVGRGKHIAYPFFELDTFNEIEKHHLGYPDGLLVSSQWAKDVVEDNGISNSISVVPPGVDLSVFNHRLVEKKRNNVNTVFFNCGKWEVRKGHDFLWDAFNKAFEPDDMVELWLATHNPFLTPQEFTNWVNLYRDTPLGQAGKIKILGWSETQSELAQRMAYADCGVFPSRGEGWNLELLEMMAMGKPVITTDYSAHTEFCNVGNSLLIDIDDTEEAYDGKWFYGQGNWAKFGEDQMDYLIEHMRTVHKKVAHTDKYLVNEAGIKTAEKFTWDATAKKIVDLLLT